MLNRRILVFLTLAGLVTVAANAASAQELKVDLASDPGTEQIEQTPPGDYTILIVDKAPKNAYSVQIEVNFTPIAPLPPPDKSVESRDPTCSKLVGYVDDIRNSDDEKFVSGLVSEIRRILKDKTCTDEVVTNAANSAVDVTEQKIDDRVYTLANGQELKVTVSRDSGKDGKKWTFIFRTPSPGRWFSSYGFVFVPNQDERYFSKLKQGTTDKYLVTRAAHNSGNDFSPSLFYSWLPASRETMGWSFGISAGLGFDQSNPIVFVGPMGTFHQNISLLFGAVVHKQKRLNGMYSPEQEIGENLTEAQLTEQTYRANVFFGLSFRFGSNPFTTDSSASKPTQKQKAEPK